MGFRHSKFSLKPSSGKEEALPKLSNGQRSTEELSLGEMGFFPSTNTLLDCLISPFGGLITLCWKILAYVQTSMS